MIRTHVLAIRVALVACSIATLFRHCPREVEPVPVRRRGRQPTRTRARRTRPGASDTAGAGADRSHRLVGVGRHRRLALADGDAAEGRLRERADQRRRSPGRRHLGSGQGRARRQRMQGVRRAAIMRVPGRLHITWQDENSLKSRPMRGLRRASALQPSTGHGQCPELSRG